MSIILSTKLRINGSFLMHWCPGCNERHLINISGNQSKWNWNNDIDKPTISPSVLHSTNHPRNEKEINNPVTYTKCHYFIRNGHIEFCGDSAHDLAGKTVTLPDFPI